MSNPILIEVTRGPLVESVHTGALAVASAGSEVLLSLGDTSRPIFPRSAVKPFQCLPLIESGAADRFGFGAAEIALACASHSGSSRHTAVVADMLARIGLDPSALGCGAHPPLGNGAAEALAALGEKPTALHNNCSGKHAGMLATAVHRGEPVAHYWEEDHPVQHRVRSALSDFAGLDLAPGGAAIDGCSVPTWALPLAALATAFARLGSADGGTHGRVARRILEACWQEPEMVAGRGRTDTILLAKLPGRVFVKTGAEGVYGGAFPKLGLGFAVKIDDGATRAAAGAAMALVERLYPLAQGLLDRQTLRNWRGVEVGRIQSSNALDRALRELPRAGDCE